MTRSEALFYFCAWARNNLLRHEEREKGIDNIYDMYEAGFEVVKKGENND